MGVRMAGGDFNELFKRIEKEIGEEKMTKVTDKALLEGARLVAEELERVFRSGSQKENTEGETAKEVFIDKPGWNKKGESEVVIRWKGPKDRFRIIHLNEHGSVKIPNPPFKGYIANTMRRVEEVLSTRYL